LPGNRKRAYLQHNKYNMSIIELIISSIAPHDCVGCRVEGAVLCVQCAHSLPVLPPRCYRCGALTDDFQTCQRCRSGSDLFAVQVATPYGDTAKATIARLKFERARAAADDIAALMAERLAIPAGTLITHLPTANTRVRQRGYDQAQQIARRLAALTGNTYRPLLARQGAQRQLGQDRAIRRKQMEGAFVAVRVEALKDRRILLIDDVLTTGASCEAAARVLKDAGAARVSAAVFAAA
jgi:ComF family protein